MAKRKAARTLPGLRETLLGKRPPPVLEDIARIGDVTKAIVMSPWELSKWIAGLIEGKPEAEEPEVSPEVAPTPEPAPPNPLLSLLTDVVQKTGVAFPQTGAGPPLPIPIPPMSPVAGGQIRPAAAPGEMGAFPGGIMAHLPEPVAPTPEPMPFPTPAPPTPEEEGEEGVQIADLPGEEVGSLRRLVEAALAGGREVEVTTPEGMPLPFAQAPPGTYGAGGYFDPGAGAPLTLMRQAPPPPSDEELMDKIMENPFNFIQKTELLMGKEGMDPEKRPATRQVLAELLTRGGFNPGIANAYAQRGLGDPQLDKMMSQEFSTERAGQLDMVRQLGYEERQVAARIAQEQRAEAGRKRLMFFEAMLPAILAEGVQEGVLPAAVLGAGGTTARMTDQQRKLLMQEAKDMGKKGVAVVLPTGQLFAVLFKHKWGLLKSNVKENQTFKAEVRQLLRAGKGLPKDIELINMSPTRVPLGGAGGLPFMGGAAGPPEEDKETERVSRIAREALSGK